MTPLSSVAEIRDIERQAAAALPPGTLMQRAGQAAAAAALDMLGGRSVLVLAGPGNNGGDALEAAANLADAGIAVCIVHLAGDAPTAPETAQALARARRSAAVFIGAQALDQHWDLVIDGLFGIGLARPLDGAGGNGCVGGETEQVADPGHGGVAILFRIVGQQLVRHQPPIGLTRYAVGERATAINPE